MLIVPPLQGSFGVVASNPGRRSVATKRSSALPWADILLPLWGVFDARLVEPPPRPVSHRSLLIDTRQHQRNRHQGDHDGDAD